MADFASGTTCDPEGARIGYLLRMYPRFSQTFVVNEVLELERQGLELRIASLRLPNEGQFHESIARVRARADYLPDRLLGDLPRRLHNLWSRFRHGRAGFMRAVRLLARHRGERWFELVQAVELIQWVHRHRLDHVHVHFGTDEATVALLAHLLDGLSYSMTLHAFDIFRDNVDQALLARKITASQFTVTVCESNRRHLLNHVPGVDPAKVRVIYNGIDLDRFAPNHGRREPLTLFSVGRLIEKKGFAFLVRAVAELRRHGLPVRCEIAGEGRERSALARLIRDEGLKDHVRLLGPLEQEQVRRKMQSAACFALPCVQAADGNMDALPTVLLEAMACGCPCISTSLSGIPEIITHESSGLLVPPEKTEPLASAIKRVLTNPELAGRLSGEARAQSERRFNVVENVAKLRMLMTHVAAGEPTPAEPAAAESSASASTPSVTGEAA